MTRSLAIDHGTPGHSGRRPRAWPDRNGMPSRAFPRMSCRACFADIPAGRAAEPAEVAALAAFIASDEADYMSGTAVIPRRWPLSSDRVNGMTVGFPKSMAASRIRFMGETFTDPAPGGRMRSEGVPRPGRELAAPHVDALLPAASPQAGVRRDRRDQRARHEWAHRGRGHAQGALLGPISSARRLIRFLRSDTGEELLSRNPKPFRRTQNAQLQGIGQRVMAPGTAVQSL